MEYFEWNNGSSKCKCGWNGPNTDMDCEQFDELFEIFCPKCGKKFGLVSYPSERQVVAAASKGDKEAKKMQKDIKKQKNYAKLVTESQIRKASDLVDISDESIHIDLTLEEESVETWLIVLANGIELGRERCFFESTEPAERLLPLLEEKFGSRLKTIRWESAGIYLCGDARGAGGALQNLFRRYQG